MKKNETVVKNPKGPRIPATVKDTCRRHMTSGSETKDLLLVHSKQPEHQHLGTKPPNPHDPQEKRNWAQMDAYELCERRGALPFDPEGDTT